jgi:hypothetical protein
MKKPVAMFLVFGLLAQWSLPVKRADALIGLIVYSAKNHKVGLPLMITGGVGILPGAPIVGLIAAAAYTPATTGFAVASAGLVGVGAGIFAALIGLVVLDAPAMQQELAFDAITDAEAASLGISEAEQSAYNHELPEINALRETVRDEVLRAGNPSFLKTSTAWQSYSGLLDPQAFNALKKVSAGIRTSIGG